LGLGTESLQAVLLSRTRNCEWFQSPFSLQSNPVAGHVFGRRRSNKTCGSFGWYLSFHTCPCNTGWFTGLHVRFTTPLSLPSSSSFFSSPKYVHQALVNPSSGRQFASITTINSVGHLVRLMPTFRFIDCWTENPWFQIPQERPKELALHLLKILSGTPPTSPKHSSRLWYHHLLLLHFLTYTCLLHFSMRFNMLSLYDFGFWNRKSCIYSGSPTTFSPNPDSPTLICEVVKPRLSYWILDIWRIESDHSVYCCCLASFLKAPK
jgi:hypothetical protein